MALTVPQGQLALVRHVFLLCAGKPWVFARSVIPPRTLRGAHRRLANLGTRPLGAILFSDRSVRRGEVRVCELKPRQPLFDLASAALDRPPEGAWARRSIFTLREKPLLVTEVFLPEMVNDRGMA